MEAESTEEKIQRLERENQVLQRKLKRTQTNLARLEDVGEKNESFLRKVILELHDAQAAVERANKELEERVAERTKALADINLELHQEIEERRQIEHQLRLQGEELVDARDKAIQANQAKSRFLARMSHELRTPLNAIIGYAEILEEDAVEMGVPTLCHDLQKIHSSGHHLLGLIDDVLDLSLIEAGRQECHIELIELRSLIDGVTAMLKPLFAKSGNALQVDWGNPPASFLGDQRKVQQILINLLNNANKFTHQGDITLVLACAQEPTPQIIFRVRDTGIGIPPSQLQRIFEPFTQSDDSSTRRYGGTGLGLAISRHFCEMMGGSLTVESAQEQGSTFSVALPILPSSR